MKVIIDMNLSPRWCRALTDAGVEAKHWSDLGDHGATDVQIMAYAKEHDYVVLTHDLDFGAILAATNGEKPSVVQIRADNTDPDVIGAQVVRALWQMTKELDEGALMTVDPTRTKLRVLPLQIM